MFSFDTIIVSLPRQSFNDALNCYEQVNKIDKEKDPFEYWKYCTWSIMSASISMESYLTHFVRCKSKQTGNEEHLSDIQDFPSRIRFLKEVLGCEIPLYDSTEFKKIKLARNVRNDIIHYRKENIFGEITKQNAIDSINACRELVTFVLTGYGENPRTKAAWVFETQSRKIT